MSMFQKIDKLFFFRGGSTGSPSTGGAQSRGAGGASSGGGGPIMNYSEGVIPLENGQTRNSP